MRTIRFCSVVFSVTSSLAVIHTIYRDCVYSARARLVARAEEPRRRWLYRAWRLVVEYPQYTTSDISVTTCEMVAVVHRRPCLQITTPRSCCSVNIVRDFCCTPPAFNAPVRKVPVGISPSRLVGKKLEWRGCPTVKKCRRYLYSFWHNSQTWQTHRHTTPHDGIGRAYASHRAAKTIGYDRLPRGSRPGSRKVFLGQQSLSYTLQKVPADTARISTLVAAITLCLLLRWLQHRARMTIFTAQLICGRERTDRRQNAFSLAAYGPGPPMSLEVRTAGVGP